MNDLNTKLVTVFGGGGFVGRYVVQALCAAGARVRVAVRHPRGAEFVKPLGNLGQVSLCAADITKPGSVANALAGADMAINLVGSFDEPDAVQNVGAANVAKAAARANGGAGVSRLVHISAIGADAGATSVYGRSKAAGEAAVRAAFPSATILRPSIIFGREDQFINRFAALIRMLPVVPVIGSGGEVSAGVCGRRGKGGGRRIARNGRRNAGAGRAAGAFDAGAQPMDRALHGPRKGVLGRSRFRRKAADDAPRRAD